MNTIFQQLTINLFPKLQYRVKVLKKIVIIHEFVQIVWYDFKARSAFDRFSLLPLLIFCKSLVIGALSEKICTKLNDYRR
jgi:hypothetical protein